VETEAEETGTIKEEEEALVTVDLAKAVDYI
jgi:hypothetical protein